SQYQARQLQTTVYPLKLPIEDLLGFPQGNPWAACGFVPGHQGPCAADTENFAQHCSGVVQKLGAGEVGVDGERLQRRLGRTRIPEVECGGPWEGCGRAILQEPG